MQTLLYIFSHLLQSNYAVFFLRLLCQNQSYLLLRSHYSLLRNHSNNTWPPGVFMFQVCVPKTGKQEVNIPLGISVSSIGKSLFGKRDFFFYNTPYCQYMLQIKKKKMLCISTQIPIISVIILDLAYLFFMIFCSS